MATIYEKIVGDKTVILEPREAAIRIPLASSNDWTELRVGMFISHTSTGASNAAWSAESFATSTVYDRTAFGLKNSDNDDLPGVAGTSFWGYLGPNGATTDFSTAGLLRLNQVAQTTAYYVSSSGTTLNQVTATQPSITFPTTAQAQAATNFAKFFGIKYVISNRGTASQTVTMQIAQGIAGAVTDTSETALRAVLINFSSQDVGTTSASMTANDGVSAYTVPDAFFFRWAFLQSRVRLHNVMVMQAAP